MRSNIIKFSIVVFVALAACSPKVVSFTNSDVERAKSKFPEANSVAYLTEGQTHYKNYCGNCHALKAVTSQSEEGWRKVVPNMVKMANKKLGVAAISPQMEEQILAYVVTMSTAPSK